MDDWFARRGIRRTDEVSNMLVIPDIRQRCAYDCGDAAIDAALEAVGVKTRGRERLANPVQGMHPATVAAVIRSLGVNCCGHNWRLEDLRHFTQTGRPVLCPVTNADGDGHWVVVRGVSRGRVYFHDPAAGPSSMPVLTWQSGWADTSSDGHEFDRWGVVVGD